MLEQLLVIIIGFHYGQLLASFSPSTLPSTLIPVSWLIPTTLPPPPPHPCVQCAHFNRTTREREPWRPFLPLSACGYGPSNFTWVHYTSYECGGDPFEGLGFDKSRWPKKTEVWKRARALQGVWDSSRGGGETFGDGVGVEEKAGSGKWGQMGLTTRQLEVIDLKIFDMEDKVMRVVERAKEEEKMGHVWLPSLWREQFAASERRRWERDERLKKEAGYG